MVNSVFFLVHLPMANNRVFSRYFMMIIRPYKKKYFWTHLSNFRVHSNSCKLYVHSSNIAHMPLPITCIPVVIAKEVASFAWIIFRMFPTKRFKFALSTVPGGHSSEKLLICVSGWMTARYIKGGVNSNLPNVNW